MTEQVRTLHDDNLSLVNAYIEFKGIDTHSYKTYLREFAHELTKSIYECDNGDIEDFLRRHCHKGGTWNTALSTLRGFYKWLTNRDTEIPEKKWRVPEFFNLLEWKSGESNKYSATDMWTEEEILWVIEACDHPRDKAVIALGYDVAGRPVEINNMRIKDVIFKENYANVKLVDHSGTRYPPITFSYEYVLEWINHHPLKDNPDAPLWVRVDRTPKKMAEKWIWQLLVKRIKPKLSHRIHKPFNPYCVFDHSRLSSLADHGFSDTDLKSFRNWRPNSKMANRYIHMSGEGVRDKILALHGLKTLNVEAREQILKSRACHRCKHRNTVDAKICVKCSFPLSVEGYEELKAREEEKDQRINALERKFEHLVDIITHSINGSEVSKHIVKMALLRHIKTPEEISKMRDEYCYKMGLIDPEGKHVCFYCDDKFDGAKDLYEHLHTKHVQEIDNINKWREEQVSGEKRKAGEKKGI